MYERISYRNVYFANPCREKPDGVLFWLLGKSNEGVRDSVAVMTFIWIIEGQ